MTKIVQISIEKIVAGPHAQRLEVEDEGLGELAASIRRIGIIVPLLVRPDGDRYVIIAGHRRFAAAGNSGLAEVPCCIRKDKEADSAEVSLAENLFRTDLTPVERASALKDVLDKEIMTVTELARAVHRSEHWLAQQIAILSWPVDVIGLVHRGKISVSAASNLALITADDYRGFLLHNAEENGVTARVTAAWLQAWRAASPVEEAVEAEPVPAGRATTPAIPQAPCLVCGQVLRTDGLAMVLVCPSCINAVRGATAGGAGH